MSDKTKIKTPTSSFVVHYPEAVDFMDKQLSVFWTHSEVKVEKDIQDIIVNMTPAEKHGVMTTLKLFTLYEMKAGTDYWSGRFMKEFPRPELEAMAATFGMFELAVHAKFYNRINELLHINTDEFYASYVQDETLKARLDFIDDVVNDPDTLVSLGAFSMVEGVILYSNFAYLKHFQSQGKNKLTNVVRGINFSVRDENIHSEAGAWTFRTLKKEMELDEDQESSIHQRLIEVATKLYEHECRIVDMIFEQGTIPGITAVQMKHFVESRIDECMKALGYPKMFQVKYNPIADWFYDGINGFAYNDFFSGMSNSYHRNWESTGFVWETTNE